MKIFESQEEAELARKQLEENLLKNNLLESSEYSKHIINWVSGLNKNKLFENFKEDDLNEYLRCKIYNSRMLIEAYNRLFLILSPKDEIEGKAQLIHQNLQSIAMIRKVVKKVKGEDEQIKYLFIDDKYDQRFDGKTDDVLYIDFYVYRIVYKDRDYYVFSQKKIPNEYCIFKGCKINMDDLSEINTNLKIKKISTIFIVESFESKVKTLDKKDLIEFIKSKEITKECFHNYLFSHPDGNIYDYTDDFNMLRKAQLLSSKINGYPLHLFKMGPVGTGKTTEAEVLDYKFREDQGILEASNSTLKALVPSFKEKPANLGYICKCNRVAIIDEMLKMVEASLGHDMSRVNNYFGQMNMLLEQKNRMVGSGNDNSTKVQSTSKLMITTNNIGNRPTIASHLNLLDTTTMSRMLIWVQDSEEVNKIYDKEDIKEYEPCDKIDNDDFLTIYDSCQNFIVDYDKDKCKMIFNTISSLADGKMKDVWRSRGLHHTILLLDGITKHRCLFIDNNSNFKSKKCDYEMLERILVHMIKGWKVNFNLEVDLI